MVAKNSTVSGGLGSGGLSACRTANEFHEGMTRGAVAKKRSTATGPDEQTLIDQPTSSFACPKRYPQRMTTKTLKKEAVRLRRGMYVCARTNEKKKTGEQRENPLDSPTSFRDDTPNALRRQASTLHAA